MIKVRILRGVTVAGTAAMTIPTLVGCGSSDAVENPGVDEQNQTESVAGSGSLTLHGFAIHYASTSGGDEFIRVGEKLKVIVDRTDIFNAWEIPAAARDSLKLTAKVQFRKADGSVSNTTDMSLKDGNVGPLPMNISDEFVIPAGVKLIRVLFAGSYQDGGKTKSIDVSGSLGQPQEFIVFGAFLPNKLALFDTAGATKRTRVVEGGAAIRGADLTLSVTDWRLDSVIDKSQLDLRVGDQQSGNRFGPSIVPAYGELQYEVEAAVSTDGGATYQPTKLSKNVHASVLGEALAGRFAFEKAINVPNDAGDNIKIAFHVKAFLKVPENNILNARYQLGARIALKDVWDNNGGKDYAVAVGNK